MKGAQPTLRRRRAPLQTEESFEHEREAVDPLSPIKDWRTTTSEKSAFVPIFRRRVSTPPPPTSNNESSLPPIHQGPPPMLLTISTSSSSCSQSAAVSSPTDIRRNILLPTSPTTPPPLLRKPVPAASQRETLSPFDDMFDSSSNSEIRKKRVERISSPNPTLFQELRTSPTIGQSSTAPSPKRESSPIDWKRLNLGFSLITSAHLIGFLWAFYVYECEEENRSSVLAESVVSYWASDDNNIGNSKKIFLPLQLCGSTWIWMVLAVYPFFLNATTNHQERSEHSASWIPLKFNYVLMHCYSLKSMAWLLLSAALAYFREQHILRQAVEKLGGFMMEPIMTNKFGSWVPLEENGQDENEEEFVLHVLLVYGITSWIWTSLLALPMLISMSSVTCQCNRPTETAASDTAQRSSTSSMDERHSMVEDNHKHLKNDVEEEEDFHDYTWILCTVGSIIFLCGFLVQLWLEMKTFRSTQDYYAAVHNSLAGAPCWLLQNCQEPISLAHSNSRHLLDKGEVVMWLGVFIIHSPRLWLLPRPRTRQLKPLAYAVIAGLVATALACVVRQQKFLETIPRLLVIDDPDNESESEEGIYAILVKAALTRHDVFSSDLRSFKI